VLKEEQLKMRQAVTEEEWAKAKALTQEYESQQAEHKEARRQAAWDEFGEEFFKERFAPFMIKEMDQKIEEQKEFDRGLYESRLEEQKSKISQEIKNLDKKIKENYPDFKRSYDYPCFTKLINKTDAKYLLKYDRVQIKTMFFGANKLYTINNIDEDFPNLNEDVKNYIRIKALQRKLKRVSSRLNKLEKYYRRPTELFARFIEGLFIDTNKVAELAPYTYLVFCKELTNNKYYYLADFINKFF